MGYSARQHNVPSGLIHRALASLVRSSPLAFLLSRQQTHPLPPQCLLRMVDSPGPQKQPICVCISNLPWLDFYMSLISVFTFSHLHWLSLSRSKISWKQRFFFCYELPLSLPALCLHWTFDKCYPWANSEGWCEE